MGTFFSAKGHLDIYSRAIQNYQFKNQPATFGQIFNSPPNSLAGPDQMTSLALYGQGPDIPFSPQLHYRGRNKKKKT